MRGSGLMSSTILSSREASLRNVDKDSWRAPFLTFYYNSLLRSYSRVLSLIVLIELHSEM